MNYYLAIDTATKNCSVGLFNSNELMDVMNFQEEGYAHSEKLLGFIKEIIQRNGLRFTDLSGLLFSEGPGSYTGLRIGASALKGIAFASKIPVYSISSLKVLYYSGRAEVHKDLYLCMIDARRDEVYLGVYDADGNLLEEESAQVIDESFFQKYEGKNCLLVGDGAPKFQDRWNVEERIKWSEVKTNKVDALLPYILEIEKGEIAPVDTAYFVPNYIKSYVAGKRKKVF